MKYRDFTISIQAASEGGYQVRVTSPAGEGTSRFELPFDADEVLRVLAALGQTVRSAERDVVVQPSPPRPPTEIGQQLFESLFTGAARDLFQASLGMVEADRDDPHGLRLKLQFDPTNPEVAKLASLPWELMYRPGTQDYLNLSSSTPLVRYLEVGKPHDATPQSDVLRVLVVMASPEGEAPLDLHKEVELIRTSWASRPGVEVDFLENATKKSLRGKLGQSDHPYHVLHFMGHGGFDPKTGTGVLLLEDEEGKAVHVDGKTLRVILDGTSMRLVVLNACNTARVTDRPGADPFAGVATSLVQDGFTAVVAMQFPISDEAAVEFAGEFYPRLARSAPIDEAVAEGRKAILIARPSSLEWATPVLFMRSRDGILINIVAKPGEVSPPIPPVIEPRPVDLPPVAPKPGPEPVAPPAARSAAHPATQPPTQPTGAPTTREAGPPPAAPVTPLPPSVPPSPRPAWQKAALFGGVPVAALLAFLFWPHASAPASLQMLQLEPSTAGTLDTAMAALELKDDAGIVIDDADRLAAYEATWTSSDTSVATVTSSGSTQEGHLTAQVLALRPGTARISGSIGDLKDSRILTVVLSDASRVAARRAYDGVKALAGDSTAQDTAVVAAYRTLLQEHGFALEGDRDGAQKAMTDLALAIQAFSVADSTDGAERPFRERLATWSGFVDRFGSGRMGPTLGTARARLGGLNQILVSEVTADTVRTCADAQLRTGSGGYKYCTTSTTHFSRGPNVNVYVVYSSPKAGRLVGKRDGAQVWSYPVSRRTSPGHTYFAFAASDEGCREITVENDKGVLLWRTHVAVGSDDACPADSGGS